MGEAKSRGLTPPGHQSSAASRVHNRLISPGELTGFPKRGTLTDTRTEQSVPSIARPPFVAPFLVLVDRKQLRCIQPPKHLPLDATPLFHSSPAAIRHPMKSVKGIKQTLKVSMSCHDVL